MTIARDDDADDFFALLNNGGLHFTPDQAQKIPGPIWKPPTAEEAIKLCGNPFNLIMGNDRAVRQLHVYDPITDRLLINVMDNVMHVYPFYEEGYIGSFIIPDTETFKTMIKRIYDFYLLEQKHFAEKNKLVKALKIISEG